MTVIEGYKETEVDAYPFLRCARRSGLDYGLVLSFASAITKSDHEMTYWEVDALRLITEAPLAAEEIRLVSCNEHFRRLDVCTL